MYGCEQTSVNTYTRYIGLLLFNKDLSEYFDNYRYCRMCVQSLPESGNLRRSGKWIHLSLCGWIHRIKLY